MRTITFVGLMRRTRVESRQFFLAQTAQATWPQFPQTGDKLRSPDENSTQDKNKQGIKLVFLSLIGPDRSFTPSFGFASACTFLTAVHLLLKSKSFFGGGAIKSSKWWHSFVSGSHHSSSIRKLPKKSRN